MEIMDSYCSMKCLGELLELNQHCTSRFKCRSNSSHFISITIT